MDQPDHPVSTLARRVQLHRFLFLAIMVAVGLVLFIFENFLPQPLPGGRIGLSQLVTLLVLFWYGFPEALAVVLLRVFIGNLILGMLFSPVFVLSTTGAVVALLVMATVRKVVPVFSIIGISLIGALFHNLTQLVVAYGLFIERADIFWLLPYCIWVSVFSGLFIGFIAWFVLVKLKTSMLPFFTS